MRIVLVGIIAGCSGTQSPDPTETSTGGPTTSSPGAFLLSWEPDDGDVVVAKAYADSASTNVVGGACTPSYLVSAQALTEPELAVSLYFDMPPAPTVATPLSITADLTQLWIAVEGQGESIRGGEVEVLAFADDGWGFRLSGDDLVRCVQSECTPLPGAELWVRPGTSPRLPEPDTRCFAGEPYTWPNGWEACAVLSGSYDFGDCPETVPW